jgi:hypothetical protein
MRYSPRFPHAVCSNPILSIRSIALAFMCIAMLSCSTTTSVSPSKSTTAGIEQFPMAIGDSWRYAVVDSLHGTLDTVSVEVESPNSANRQFSSMWVFKGNSYEDTMYVLVENSSVMMYEDPLSSLPDFTITFPLVEGASWGKGPDTTTVYSETSVAVPAGTFDDAFIVDRHAVSFNYRLDSEQWIVPDIGIVRWHKKEFNLGPAVNQRWALIGYELGQ